MQVEVTKIYGAVPDSRLTDEDAAKIGPELERLSTEREATAAEIVTEAADEDSPLHPYFEWDDAEAGKRYREDQARNIARSIEVTFVSADGAVASTSRAFLAVDTAGPERTKKYVTVEFVRSSPELSTEVLEQARAEFLGRKKKFERYRDLFAREAPELLGVMEAIDRLE